MNISTSDQLVSPVIKSEFSDWAKLDSDDPTIDACLSLATSAVINFLKQDLLNRKWTLTTTPNNTIIELPYTKLVSIESITLDGESIAPTDYKAQAGKPYKIAFNNMVIGGSELVIEYIAGFGEQPHQVPNEIKNAIKMVATYVHSHNGACDGAHALEASGAKSFIIQHAVNGGIAI